MSKERRKAGNCYGSDSCVPVFISDSPRLRESSIACWDNVGPLDHEDHATLGCAGPMSNAFWNDKALTWGQLDDFVLKVDQEFSIEHKKELVDVIVFVPVIFTLQHAESHHRIVHFAQRLVVPLVLAGISQLLHVN